MRRFLLLLLPLAVLLAGCASHEDIQAYYDANVAMAQARRPLVRMVARDGQDIVLKGVKEFEVYGAQPGGVAQHKDEVLQAVREWGGIAGAIAGVWLGGDVAVRLADTVGRHAGIHGSFTGAGPVLYSPGSAADNAGSGPGLFYQPDNSVADDHSMFAAPEE